jgi:hypothetical protein
LKAYATGKDKHPDIQFIMIVNDPKRVENCAKLFLKDSRYRGSQELYKTDINKIKKLVFECAMIDKMVAENIKNKSLSACIHKFRCAELRKTLESDLDSYITKTKIILHKGIPKIFD